MSDALASHQRHEHGRQALRRIPQEEGDDHDQLLRQRELQAHSVRSCKSARRVYECVCVSVCECVCVSVCECV